MHASEIIFLQDDDEDTKTTQPVQLAKPAKSIVMNAFPCFILCAVQKSLWQNLA